MKARLMDFGNSLNEYKSYPSDVGVDNVAPPPPFIYLVDRRWTSIFTRR